MPARLRTGQMRKAGRSREKRIKQRKKWLFSPKRGILSLSKYVRIKKAPGTTPKKGETSSIGASRADLSPRGGGGRRLAKS